MYGGDVDIGERELKVTCLCCHRNVRELKSVWIFESAFIDILDNNNEELLQKLVEAYAIIRIKLQRHDKYLTLTKL
jgi:hypothetical protein